MAEYFSFDNVNDWLYYRVITVTDPKTRSKVVWVRWDLPFDLVVKYKWYFNYRAALLQVEYPKHIVEIMQGRFVKSLEDLNKNKASKVRARKAKITEMKNKLKKFDENNNKQLFKFDDHPARLKFIERLEASERELKRLEDTDVSEFYDKHNLEYKNGEVFNFK